MSSLRFAALRFLGRWNGHLQHLPVVIIVIYCKCHVRCDFPATWSWPRMCSSYMEGVTAAKHSQSFTVYQRERVSTQEDSADNSLEITLLKLNVSYFVCFVCLVIALLQAQQDHRAHRGASNERPASSASRLNHCLSCTLCCLVFYLDLRHLLVTFVDMPINQQFLFAF